MNLRIIGPIAQTGYGVVTTQLTSALMEEGVKIQLIPLGKPSFAWMTNGVERNCMQALKTTLANHDFTLCIWHEWDHPPKHANIQIDPRHGYIAMPTFELSKVSNEAVTELGKCWRVLVSSQWCEAVLQHQGLSNVHMEWFHGVDTNIFKPSKLNSIERNRYRFINVGKLEKRKGHDICIRTIAYLMKQGIDAELWAMWDNPFLDAMGMSQTKVLDTMIADAAKDMGVEVSQLFNRIKKIPPVSNSRTVAATMSLCDCGLYPFRAEGWNLPLLETLACGLPVIATGATGPLGYLTSALCIDPSCAALVGGELRPAVDGIWFKGQGEWVEPDVNSIFKLAHKAASCPKYTTNVILYIREHLTWEHAARRILRWLDSGCALS